MSRGVLFVMSGPSGTGKGTICNELLANENNDVFLSVSSTTREKRKGETDGVTYNYTTVENFKKMIDNGEMLEYAMYSGNYYGTPREPVEKAVAAGDDIIIEVDVNGAAQIRKKLPDAVSIFIMPPSFAELKRRLVGRGTDSAAAIEKRLNSALGEIKRANEYDYIIVNDSITAAADDIMSVILSSRFKTDRQKEIINEVLKEC